eukprot:CAMPEP_0202949544 /NCGR_PEP_ID=MMETSP1395-20130829/16235_1 /ASSEMBLY_ACC=CAM_ASM_000871 /TAXON_ID=5961 /ORGANISM="Blepharisma japonicum, Strain Stock R1072" /LENGTH=62 /DNA_ID=CAMNT_0049652659 /DNA_START=30 /DNA_END=218 /DNA_ORIENTATION=+
MAVALDKALAEGYFGLLELQIEGIMLELALDLVAADIGFDSFAAQMSFEPGYLAVHKDMEAG